MRVRDKDPCSHEREIPNSRQNSTMSVIAAEIPLLSPCYLPVISQGNPEFSIEHEISIVQTKRMVVRELTAVRVDDLSMHG